MHCQQSRRKRLVVHTGKMVTRLFAERNFCRKSFFVALRIRERSDMAAKKDGIHMVLVPEKNEPDVRELDAEITDGLQIEFVGSMEQVLKLALVEKK